MLTNLSGPQKVLVVLSAILTFCYLISVVYVLFLQSGQINLTVLTPTRVNSGFDITLQNLETQTSSVVKSGQEITAEALTRITWGNNTALLLPESKIAVSENEIVLTSGSGLFNIFDTQNIGGWQMNKSVFAVANNQIYVFSGSGQKAELSIKEGNKVALNSDAIGNITRREVINLVELSTLRENSQLVAQNIDWLTDITAPKLLTISPIPNATLFVNTVTVRGEIDDRLAKIEVNGAELTNENATFSTEVLLSEGENTILIRLSDVYGNSESTELLVNYEATAR